MPNVDDFFLTTGAGGALISFAEENEAKARKEKRKQVEKKGISVVGER